MAVTDREEHTVSHGHARCICAYHTCMPRHCILDMHWCRRMCQMDMHCFVKQLVRNAFE